MAQHQLVLMGIIKLVCQKGSAMKVRDTIAEIRRDGEDGCGRYELMFEQNLKEGVGRDIFCIIVCLLWIFPSQGYHTWYVWLLTKNIYLDVSGQNDLFLKYVNIFIFQLYKYVTLHDKRDSKNGIKIADPKVSPGLSTRVQSNHTGP